MFNKFFKNKEVKNAGWLIGGKIIQMLLSLVVGIFTARYLGPGNYGLVNYGIAYVAFFTSLATLGLNSVIVKDFFDHPEEQGTAIGSALVMRFLSGLLSVILIVTIVFFIDYGQTETIIIVALCGLGLIFNIFETFNYWFQAQYKSKVTAIATLIAYGTVSVYKIILLITQQNVIWFALATSIDYVAVAIILFIFYKVYSGPKLKFSWGKCKQLLKISYHYILPGLMVAVYGQTDKIMLKQMTSEEAVGYYATGVTLCSMWTFVLNAIIDSIYPTILKLKKDGDQEAYERKNRQLYAIVFYVSTFVSISFVLLGNFAIEILYGKEFLPASSVLKIITWYTAFSYLGVARNAWIVSENKQKYITFLYVGAAVANVGLNFALIPIWGADGAAVASLVAQVLSGMLLPFFIKPLRPNAKLMMEAICFIKVKSCKNDIDIENNEKS